MVDLEKIKKADNLEMIESDTVGFGLIRMVPIGDNEFLFHAKDCALILEYKNPERAIRKFVPTDQKLKLKVKNFKVTDSVTLKLGNFGAVFITEEGLYRLISCSKMDKAEEFRSWVFGEVLPTFRKTGKYDMVDFKKSKHRKTIQDIPGFAEDVKFKDQLKRDVSNMAVTQRKLKSRVWHDFIHMFNDVYGVNLNLKITNFATKYQLDKRPTVREYLDMAGLQKRAFIVFEMLRHASDAKIEPDRLALIITAARIFYDKLTEVEQLQVNAILKGAFIDGTIDYNDKESLKEFIRMTIDDNTIIEALK